MPYGKNMTDNIDEKPWLELSRLIAEQDAEALDSFTDSLSSDEMIHTLFQLTPPEQHQLMALLLPIKAAELIEGLPNSYAADVLENIEPEQAALIIAEMASDERANIVQEIEKDDAEDILNFMEDDDADDVRTLIEYPPDVAGGLMIVVVQETSPWR